jgi:hypothetical protein
LRHCGSIAASIDAQTRKRQTFLLSRFYQTGFGLPLGGVR